MRVYKRGLTHEPPLVLDYLQKDSAATLHPDALRITRYAVRAATLAGFVVAVGIRIE
jgi:hypothetical protein